MCSKEIGPFLVLMQLALYEPITSFSNVLLQKSPADLIGNDNLAQECIGFSNRKIILCCIHRLSYIPPKMLIFFVDLWSRREFSLKLGQTCQASYLPREDLNNTYNLVNPSLLYLPLFDGSTALYCSVYQLKKISKQINK